jgi:type IV pilus assembly protein PilM
MLEKTKRIFKSLSLRLRSSRIFGLDISDYSIEIVLLVKKDKKPQLVALGRKKLEPGIVKDAKILNKEKLKEALLDLISNPNFGKINTKNLVFAIPEIKSFVHTFEIPANLKEDEILTLVKSKARETFPFTLEELNFDYKIFENYVLLVAAPKEIVNDYFELFQLCQLKPIVFEVESLSLGRALTEEKVSVILDIGAEVTNIILFDKGKLRLSFSLNIAGDKFTKSISETLKIPLKKAEELKWKVGLNPEKKEGRVFAILQKEIIGILEEYRKIANYFRERTQKGVQEIILTGGSALLPYLSDYLSENLGKKVKVANPWQRIEMGNLTEKKLKQKLKKEAVFYSAAVGLALRGLEKNPREVGINLISD